MTEEEGASEEAGGYGLPLQCPPAIGSRLRPGQTCPATALGGPQPGGLRGSQLSRASPSGQLPGIAGRLPVTPSGPPLAFWLLSLQGLLPRPILSPTQGHWAACTSDTPAQAVPAGPRPFPCFLLASRPPPRVSSRAFLARHFQPWGGWSSEVLSNRVLGLEGPPVCTPSRAGPRCQHRGV